ncbi:hypothetical protein ISF_00047 [Cordyceps fumosorosea ARSEF 2679]|uniref:Uncharacterized protein n=1 Tax=Cordyceps fumosorosea (strain ARSEF 2679) TaxID=1081104 RepID=A0A168DY37_CORFA|nr:hypothetical protein ISF_00047 [Cordyceps fumosorosea ARSEF 2679]OAA73146.1 hypothetical protein ISF_00047 [Cordyceps fumosorosea ARSEF 2679]
MSASLLIEVGSMVLFDAASNIDPRREAEFVRTWETIAAAGSGRPETVRFKANLELGIFYWTKQRWQAAVNALDAARALRHEDSWPPEAAVIVWHCQRKRDRPVGENQAEDWKND